MNARTETPVGQPYTHFTRRDLPAPRPRLAPNVVCMFSDARPPVQQAPRRGRYPKAIASIQTARNRRSLGNLPRPVAYKLGDYVEVRLANGEWYRATITAFRGPSLRGERQFRLMARGEFFDFPGALEQYCVAGERDMRPA